jgi:HAD superfamily phosphoserine phosphatase-like hydrolase
MALAILIDYDGTICRTSISDMIMVEASVRPGWREIDDAYDEGRIGSRESLELFLPLLPVDPAPLYATAERQPHDASFPAFVARAREAGATVEVVSDGFGFYVGRNLARIGVPGLPISTADMTWSEAGPALAFPSGHPACLVCGTCKRERVLAHQAIGCHVAFVGDGVSDRYAAAHADTILAKDRLATVCEDEGIPYVSWETFDDVSAWLASVAADPGSLAPPRTRPFICGPEAWGPGRTAPPMER